MSDTKKSQSLSGVLYGTVLNAIRYKYNGKCDYQEGSVSMRIQAGGTEFPVSYHVRVSLLPYDPTKGNRLPFEENYMECAVHGIALDSLSDLAGQNVSAIDKFSALGITGLDFDKEHQTLTVTKDESEEKFFVSVHIQDYATYKIVQKKRLRERQQKQSQ